MFAKSLVLSIVFAAAASAISVSTPPTFKQCEEVTFTITGATGPVYPFVVDAAKPCDDALAELDEVTGSTFKYTPNLPVGTVVNVAIEDEQGNEGWSGKLTIEAGSSTACLSSVKDIIVPPPASSTKTTTPTPKVEAPVNAIDGDPNAPPSGAPRVLAASGLSAVAALSAFLALTL